VQKISPPPGFDPQTIQLVASFYADYAILALYQNSTECFFFFLSFFLWFFFFCVINCLRSIYTPVFEYCEIRDFYGGGCEDDGLVGFDALDC
jgi:hypothetical protein